MTLDVLTPESALLWPYLPDWGDGFAVKRTFATDIFKSRDETEQRRAQRLNPRFDVDYRTVLQESELREANEFLRAWQNRPVVIPDFARWALLTSASLPTATTLTVTPVAPAWASEGQRLALWGATREEVLVESVAGDTITIADPLTGSWPIGSVLRPTYRGLLDGKFTSRRLTKGAAELSVSLSVYPGGEPLRDVGTAWATVGTREVFTLQPDYKSGPSLSYLWPVENVDVGRGRTAQFRPVDTPQSAVDADFNGLGLTTTAQVEQFFDRMKGRRTAFYLPTWEKDGTYVSSGAASITVSGLGIYTQYVGFDFAAHEAGILVCKADGMQLPRRITSVSFSGGNSVITVSGAWGVALSLATVSRISLMPLVRFASDSMTSVWKTPLSASTRLSFQSVRR